MILSIPRPQFFYFSYKVSMVARDGTATLLWENSHNTLIKWAWDAYSVLLVWTAAIVILAYRLAKKRGRPVPIQSGSLIGWLARTTGFFMEKLLCTH